MKIACIADPHGMLPDVPECDLVIVAGDVGPWRDHSDKAHRLWYERVFAPWARNKRVVWIAGNHDLFLEHPGGDAFARTLPATYLCDETVEIDGLKIHGTPWVPTFYDWAFMADDENLHAHWEKIPSNVDILVVHGPLIEGDGPYFVNASRVNELYEPVREPIVIELPVQAPGPKGEEDDTDRSISRT